LSVPLDTEQLRMFYVKMRVLGVFIVAFLACSRSGLDAPPQGEREARAVQIAIGNLFSCALLDTGAVQCWGANDHGELGDGQQEPFRATPGVVTGLESGVVQIAASEIGVCAVRAAGELLCWGDNDSGQTGTGRVGGFVSIPTRVVGISNATRVSTSSWHSCATLGDGRLVCWGLNASGQLGDGTTDIRSTPAAVKTASHAYDVSCGAEHTCARFAGGTMQCWGDDLYGDLGGGNQTPQSTNTPHVVAGLAGSISAPHAGWNSTCALLVGGSVQCWGNNSCGELGNGSTVDWSVTPVSVSGLKARQMAMGYCGNVAVTLAGGVVRWGGFPTDDAGGFVTQSTPVTMTGFSGPVAEVAVSVEHMCARMVSGGVQCVARNTKGEVGDGTTLPRFEPTRVSGFVP